MEMYQFLELRGSVYRAWVHILLYILDNMDN